MPILDLERQAAKKEVYSLIKQLEIADLAAETGLFNESKTADLIFNFCKMIRDGKLDSLIIIASTPVGARQDKKANFCIKTVREFLCDKKYNVFFVDSLRAYLKKDFYTNIGKNLDKYREEGLDLDVNRIMYIKNFLLNNLDNCIFGHYQVKEFASDILKQSGFYCQGITNKDLRQEVENFINNFEIVLCKLDVELVMEDIYNLYVQDSPVRRLIAVLVNFCLSVSKSDSE